MKWNSLLISTCTINCTHRVVRPWFHVTGGAQWPQHCHIVNVLEFLVLLWSTFFTCVSMQRLVRQSGLCRHPHFNDSRHLKGTCKGRFSSLEGFLKFPTPFSNHFLHFYFRQYLDLLKTEKLTNTSTISKYPQREEAMESKDSTSHTHIHIQNC